MMEDESRVHEIEFHVKGIRGYVSVAELNIGKVFLLRLTPCYFKLQLVYVSRNNVPRRCDHLRHIAGNIASPACNVEAIHAGSDASAPEQLKRCWSHYPRENA